ncbi:hypothetical protein GCM10007362_05310 [Saccharibacillus endophyticus]|uniref:Uncharacterized protein n=1 Tax=Saccharibacillus endophyticus TaxID=2060666 RepID=A0ABQ1ZLR9_9BACL|nr:hypothetical protein GCM10007362_05310 [Saccharibacillus endophyticus]
MQSKTVLPMRMHSKSRDLRRSRLFGKKRSKNKPPLQQRGKRRRLFVFEPFFDRDAQGGHMQRDEKAKLAGLGGSAGQVLNQVSSPERFG